MKNILVLTDFSNTSLHAASYAGLVHETLAAEKIILYHAPENRLNKNELSPGGENAEEWKEKITAQLSGVGRQMQAQNKNYPVAAILVDEIPVAEHINEICEIHEVDLIIMGARGTVEHAEKLMGSTTTAIINAAHYPVMIVPLSAPLLPVKTVLFASDLQPIAAGVEARLDRLLNILQAKLFVLNVDRKEKEFGPDTSFELRQLHYLLDKYHPEFIFTEDADSAEGVERIATEKQASFIVTIHRKHGWLYHLLHSSISASLALYTNKVLLSLYNE